MIAKPDGIGKSSYPTIQRLLDGLCISDTTQQRAREMSEQDGSLKMADSTD